MIDIKKNAYTKLVGLIIDIGSNLQNSIESALNLSCIQGCGFTFSSLGHSFTASKYPPT